MNNLIFPLKSIKAESFASAIIEENDYSSSSIHILPTHSYNKSLVKDIIKLRQKENEEILEITVNRTSATRRKLLNEVELNNHLLTLMNVFDRINGQFQVDMSLADRKWMTGVPAHVSRRYACSHFTQDQEIALAYYMPHAVQIQSDLSLAAKCFSAAVGEKLTISEASPISIPIHEEATPLLGVWQLDVEGLVGGSKVSDTPELLVQVGPIADCDIPDWIPGVSKHLFLEEGLCKHLLPSARNWRIEIVVQPKAAECKLEIREKNTGIMELSTLLA